MYIFEFPTLAKFIQVDWSWDCWVVIWIVNTICWHGINTQHINVFWQHLRLIRSYIMSTKLNESSIRSQGIWMISSRSSHFYRICIILLQVHKYLLHLDITVIQIYIQRWQGFPSRLDHIKPYSRKVWHAELSQAHGLFTRSWERWVSVSIESNCREKFL